MSFSIEFADEHAGYDARIKVIGCGGSGGNAVNTMISFGLEGVEFLVVNTDAQALHASAAPLKLHIGANVLPVNHGFRDWDLGECHRTAWQIRQRMPAPDFSRSGARRR